MGLYSAHVLSTCIVLYCTICTCCPELWTEAKGALHHFALGDTNPSRPENKEVIQASFISATLQSSLKHTTCCRHGNTQECHIQSLRSYRQCTYILHKIYTYITFPDRRLLSDRQNPGQELALQYPNVVVPDMILPFPFLQLQRCVKGMLTINGFIWSECQRKDLAEQRNKFSKRKG